ncbi:MAG: hypothetical protein HY606_13475 [Planctomycetes bacterium]|nr:hypothetical protein [Planctomycetota bacterium]
MARYQKTVILTTIIAALSFPLLCSCATTTTQTLPALYTISLSEVIRPNNVKERYGEYTASQISEQNTLKYDYEDKMIKVLWTFESTMIKFLITNKTEYSIKVIWDEAAYVDIKGTTHRIMHSGIKYTDRQNPQPPSVVASRGTLDELILPTDYVYFSGYGVFAGWSQYPLLPLNPTIQEVNQYKGQTIKVLLPLQIEGHTNEYTFIFKIDDVRTK